MRRRCLRWARWADPAQAVQLGSDVPFCVRGGRARVTGVGETIEPCPSRTRRFVLLLPPMSVDTAAVYRAWDENRVSDGPRDRPGPGQRSRTGGGVAGAPARRLA